MNVRKRYNRIKNNSVMFKPAAEKLKILEEMSCVLSDIVNNIKYIMMYYPLDDAIRNKGYITLATPVYATHMSLLLKMLSFSMVAVSEASKNSILQKEGVVRAIQDEFNNKNSDLVDELCIISTQRLPIMILTYIARLALFWELVNRILNVRISRSTRNYRSDVLIRHNDVYFRPSVAVISEKRNT